MNERKYNHYIAWFNVNIKCLNVCEPAPAAHDYRISAPLDEVQQPSVVSRLKLTAHRRSAAAPVVTDEPEVIVIKKDGFVKNQPPIVVSSNHVLPPLPQIINKKRTRDEFEGQ